MGLIGQGLVLAAGLRGRQLERHAADPRRAQLRTLRQLMRQASGTAFGRQYGLGEVRTPRQLALRLPIHSYEDMEPWILRARDGERDVIWPGRIRYFARSSGTSSGRNKTLPITSASIRQQRKGGFDSIAAWLRKTGDASLFDKQAILLGGSSELQVLPSGALYGVNTGIMANHIPFFVQHVYRPSPEIRRLEDWDEKLDRLVAETLDADVRLVAGTPSWFPGLFDRLIEASRARGRQASTVRDIWPNLKLLTGGGINFEPYRALLEQRFGGPVPYLDVYNSSEGGVMGVQDALDCREMLLLPDAGVFYEFVPLDRWGDPDPPRLALWETERDVSYAVVITTLNGLYGYALGDVLRFTSVFPHHFVFEGRTSAFLNVHGEKLSQRALERAIRRVSADEQVEIADFTVSVSFDPHGGPRHVWWIEPRGSCPDPDHLARRIDEVLKQDSPIYASHRRGHEGLQAPRVRIVPRGGFHRWMRERGKLGGQNKVPRVMQTPEDESRLADIVDLLAAK